MLKTLHPHSVRASIPCVPSNIQFSRALPLQGRSKMVPQKNHIDLGDGSDVLYLPEFLDANQAQLHLERLDKEIPWVRPTLVIYGRSCDQPRDTCYVADEGLPPYKYSSYQPVVHKWDEFPTLKSIAHAVHKALPGCLFNSVLLNRYANGTDYAAWHSDDEKVYGPTPTIASVTLGKEREFLIRKKKRSKALPKQEKKEPYSNSDASHGIKSSQLEKSEVDGGLLKGSEVLSAFDVLLGKRKSRQNEASDVKRNLCMSTIDMNPTDCVTGNSLSKELYSFMLKHGSLLVMRGYTQRDWEHSVPRRKRVDGLRINLTFRYIVGEKISSQA